MTKANKRPNLSREQQAAIEAIRARSREERPGPDELIDRGELDELVPHAQYLEVRALGTRMREIREGRGLSLTDVSERSGLTRAVVSRLENGWNLNPTLETLYRYAEAIGADLHLTVDAPGNTGAETAQINMNLTGGLSPPVYIPPAGGPRQARGTRRNPTKK